VISSVVDRLWAEADPVARAARAALYPLEVAYGVAVAARGAMYDRGLLSSRTLALPAVSVGNVTVGGTGKTPVSAWLVKELAKHRARPAVVLRDYGGDEGLVHAALNPGTPVITGADRVEAVQRARDRGADVVVLDDAFQHRRARRDADLVLVSADQWSLSRRLLPAGPWREPLSALRRASVVMVTHKAVPVELVDEIWQTIEQQAPLVSRAAARIAPAALVDAHAAATRALSSLAGLDVLAIAGVAAPDAFRRQLEELGAHVRLRAFRDHYPYSADDALLLASEGARAQLVVCTLKDAVKLAPLWPRDGPSLWYLTQEVTLERGRPQVERLIADILEARARHITSAG
jgi:tetraacyldisaccharide 4'-kinase